MSWWKYAKPGDKVVCVNDGNWNYPCTKPDQLFEGGVYTITMIHPPEGAGNWPGEPVSFSLLEASNPNSYINDFCVHRFKPVKSTDKGMSIIRGLLNGNPVLEDA